MNGSAVNLTPRYATLVELTRGRAARQPDRCGYTFLADDTTKTSSLSYAELDLRARAIGAWLQQADAAGTCALLLYPPGLDYIAAFFGCLYAGVVAIPAYPPTSARLDRALPQRLRAIVRDAQPRIALTTEATAALGAALAAQAADFQSLHWVPTDSLADGLADEWRPPALSGDTLAFVQYTSGSTAAPKGVMLTHANLLHNLALIEHGFGHTPDSRGVIWLPPYHDMGLIGGILQPLYAGFPVTLMSPLAFLQRPLRWLEAISDFKATTSGGPNFAYDLCVRKITPEQRATLDLSSWRVAFNGAEPVRAETLDRFAATFAECGFRREAFYPCYGLAEATLIVSGGRVDAPPTVREFQAAALAEHQVVAAAGDDRATRMLVGSGEALPDQQVRIVDPDTLRPCPPDRVGEIWVAGPSVAQGYWNRQEETERSFHTTIDGDSRTFLRTGDLGFLHDGELFVAGRLKDLIIIRGRNHYPQDIEHTVERSHAALRPGAAAAFAVDVDDEERLVVVCEVERQQRHADIAQVAGSVRQAVAEQHELQAYAVVLLKPGGMPKTSSGKIQRHACRAAFLAGTLDAIGSSVHEATTQPEPTIDLLPADLLALPSASRQAALEAYLRSQVARVLRVVPDSIDAHQPLSGLGLDSLMAVELQHTVEAGLGIVVPMAAFLQEWSIGQLAADIGAQAAAGTAQPIEPVAPTGAHPLSAGQRALWFLHQLAPESAAYTIAQAVRVRGALDAAALQRAFARLSERHAALRTTFADRAGEPVQQIDTEPQISFQIEDATGWSLEMIHERLSAAARRPFDLQRGPLLRINLFSQATGHVLLLAIHHTIADLWSLDLLMHEMGLLYAAERAGYAAPLAPLALSYVDYARWQAQMLAGAEGERLWSYWRDHLADAATTLDLPTDRPRPAVQSYRGTTRAFALDASLTQRLKALSQTTGVTLYTTLLTAFQTLLHRYTGQRDILVGSPTTGRSRAEWAGLLGYFVNLLPMRADFGGHPTFQSLLAQVRQTVLGAFAHQDYPLPLLVERLQPDRDPSRHPLFQVVFALQTTQARQDGVGAATLGAPGARLRLGSLDLESVALDQQIAQFDLTLFMWDQGDRLSGAVEYNTDLFDAATIARMVGHFQTLLASIAANPEQPIAHLALLTEAEQQQMLVEWNRSEAEYPRAAAVHTLIEVQAARTPDVLALVFDGQALSYAELNTRANQLAHYLRAQGVGPDVLVALCVERSLEMIVGMLAILKAGGAYVPLDPAYPAERLQYMLSHSRAPVILTQAALVERLPEHQAQVFCLDADWERLAAQPTTNPPRVVLPDHLAYIIFTSGSTGRPKGVMVTQRGLINLVYGLRAYFADPQVQRTGLITSISFDISVNQIFPTLIFGRTLHVIPDAVKLD
ncbi:MAG TPA: AMP-binding protein, partial [Herpetosiphonaceae bacterium]